MNGNDKVKFDITQMKYSITYYKQMKDLCLNPEKKLLYEKKYNEKIAQLKAVTQSTGITDEENNSIENTPKLIEITLDELAQFDGSGGRPAYVAINGTIYDVSLEATWGGGTHFGLYAGRDLTGAFQGCHPGAIEILSNLPQVGRLID
jgi:predicted heme/steroid binding protein